MSNDERLDGRVAPCRVDDGHRAAFGCARQHDAVERVPIQVGAPPAVLKSRLGHQQLGRQLRKHLNRHRKRRAPLIILRKTVEAAPEQQLCGGEVARRLKKCVQRVGAIGVDVGECGWLHACPQVLEDLDVAIESSSVHEREARPRLQQPLDALLKVAAMCMQQRQRIDVALKARVHRRVGPVPLWVVRVSASTGEGFLNERQPLRAGDAGHEGSEVAFVRPHK
mmetsp:Transcript_19733/g.45417  ORF Transcript_19733/g.45417 Transcript_19733/m.45417 type:complete len:224 (-) Transcript_19733:449-1120(-)